MKKFNELSKSAQRLFSDINTIYNGFVTEAIVRPKTEATRELMDEQYITYDFKDSCAGYKSTANGIKAHRDSQLLTKSMVQAPVRRKNRKNVRNGANPGMESKAQCEIPVLQVPDGQTADESI